MGLETPGQPNEPEINLDGTAVKPARKAFFLTLGSGYSIGGDLGFQPQLGCYLDLPKTWQGGLRARLATQDAEAFYDFFPQISIDLRKLWLEDQSPDPIRNSEYFAISLGGYLAYDFAGEKMGFRPLGALTLGKYWMPVEESALGLDIFLELSRLFSGHISNQPQLVFITIGLSIFYVFP